VTRVLVDTSVWRKYFAGNARVRGLGELLDEDGAVILHPFVLGEMVLGGLSADEERLFSLLPPADLVPHEEVLQFIRRRGLARRAVGWVDAHLLASALTSSSALWSADKALAAAAAELRIAFEP
jgi:hypothetical protein